MPGMEATERSQDEEAVSSMGMQELEEDSEVIPGPEQWGRLLQVSEWAWDKEVEDVVGEKMDEELWGSLKEHISLHLVWEKLPHVELSRLRVVCKAWNTSALQRLEAKPYFVTIALGLPPPPKEPVYLNGLVRYDVASGEFSFKRHVSLKRGSYGALGPVPQFAVEGLVFCYRGVELGQGVYNLHTRTWHEVREPPITSLRVETVWGMMVDTSERPYSFRLVMGSTVTKTQIYDSRSRSWSMTSSLVFKEATYALRRMWCYSSCMSHDDCIYVSLTTYHAGQDMSVVYSMKEDRWSKLSFPPRETTADRNTLGIWDGRIFAVRMHVLVDKISVWELVDAKEQVWAEYASSSEDRYNELVTVDAHYAPMELLSFFCDEYLLVCNWRMVVTRADRLVMFNLRTKEWELVRLPMGTVSLEDHREELISNDEVDCEDAVDVDVEDDIR